MYIRRKVYSVYTDEETGEERLFCEDQIMSEEEYIDRLYSEMEQREYASIRKMKKQGKAMMDAGIDPKQVGKIAARINKQGLNKNSEKFIEQAGSDKVRKGLVNKMIKKSGSGSVSTAEKELANEWLKANQIALGKANIARGGKGIRFRY